MPPSHPVLSNPVSCCRAPLLTEQRRDVIPVPAEAPPTVNELHEVGLTLGCLICAASFVLAPRLCCWPFVVVFCAIRTVALLPTFQQYTHGVHESVGRLAEGRGGGSWRPSSLHPSLSSCHLTLPRLHVTLVSLRAQGAVFEGTDRGRQGVRGQVPGPFSPPSGRAVLASPAAVSSRHTRDASSSRDLQVGVCGGRGSVLFIGILIVGYRPHIHLCVGQERVWGGSMRQRVCVLLLFGLVVRTVRFFFELVVWTVNHTFSEDWSSYAVCS